MTDPADTPAWQPDPPECEWFWAVITPTTWEPEECDSPLVVLHRLTIRDEEGEDRRFCECSLGKELLDMTDDSLVVTGDNAGLYDSMHGFLLGPFLPIDPPEVP